jgi:hypothetical protein
MRTFERLESRLLPCTPLNVLEIVNAVNAGAYSEQYDLNADGMVSPLDALLAINATNQESRTPQVRQFRPVGSVGFEFSPCGRDYDVTVLARSGDDVELRLGSESYQPATVGTFGAFREWTFAVYGRGLVPLHVQGEFMDDELLTLIVG